MDSLDAPPPLLITMGDACGIGPEIIVKACACGAAAGTVVVADLAVMRRAVRRLDAALALAWIVAVEQARGLPRNVIAVLSPEGIDPGLADLPPGHVDARAGRAAALCIEAAVSIVRSGQAAAIVTAPIHKEALHAAGVGFPGHTEMLQALASPGSSPLPVRMMLANRELRTVLVSTHLSLREAIERVDFDSVLETIRIAHRAARRWGQPQPRIAVAGLNPHAGEGGLFGDEEIRHIAPAVQAARSEGIDASGPYAPDTVFMRARHAPAPTDAPAGTPDHPGEFDLVVAMTHDHGLIPVKYLGVEHGVNVTLGLPFVRTSPDHGTAFDLAGSGRADPSSLIEAIGWARRLARHP